MNLSRREAVIGLGTLAAGAGAISGAGAFDTVSADRDVTVEFAADSEAALGMGPVPGDDRDSITVTEPDDGVVGITIDEINRNARTVIDDVLALTNNGERRIERLTASLTDESRNAALSVHDALDGVSVDVGETVVGVGFTVDTRNDEGYVGEPDIQGTLTLRAVTAPGGG